MVNQGELAKIKKRGPSMICYTQMSSYGELAKKTLATEKDLVTAIFESIFCVVPTHYFAGFIYWFSRGISILLHTDVIQWWVMVSWQKYKKEAHLWFCYTQMSSYGELAKKNLIATEKDLITEIFESIFCVVPTHCFAQLLSIFYI